MEDKGPTLLAADEIDPLLIGRRPQGHGRQGLGLAPVEKGGSMDSGQQADLRRYGPDFRKGTTIDASFFPEDLLAQDTAVQAIEAA